jgi:hypothetical protein
MQPQWTGTRKSKNPDLELRSHKLETPSINKIGNNMSQCIESIINPQLDHKHGPTNNA